MKVKNKNIVHVKQSQAQWAKSPVCRSVFLTTWHCIKTHSFRLFFWRFFPLGAEIFFIWNEITFNTWIWRKTQTQVNLVKTFYRFQNIKNTRFKNTSNLPVGRENNFSIFETEYNTGIYYMERWGLKKLHKY